MEDGVGARTKQRERNPFARIDHKLVVLETMNLSLTEALTKVRVKKFKHYSTAQMQGIEQLANERTLIPEASM